MFLFGLMAFQYVQAYSFSAVCETGQTLYYTILSNEDPYLVSVVSPNDTNPHWNEEAEPQGMLRIPDSVCYEGINYKVVSIGACAFMDCNRLTSVDLGNSVEIIGMDAFLNCHSMISVSFGTSLQSIGTSSFYGCSGLTALVFPESLRTISEAAFYGCSGVTTMALPATLDSIASNAFADCSSLESLFVPRSVIFIDSWAFHGNAGLSSIVVEEGNAVYDSRGNCNAIIETATNKLFKGCKTTRIPNDVVTIGETSFYDCTALTECVIPTSVTKIERCAFTGCTALVSIDIPNSINSIGEYAFIRSGLTSIFLPASVTFLGTNPFRSCPDMISMTVDMDNPVFDSRDGCNAIVQTSTNTLVSGCKATIIPNTVTRIGTEAFSDCQGLTSIIIPRSVRVIGNMAFYSCDTLASLTLPSGVNTIKEHAFAGCAGLKTIYARRSKCPSTSRNSFSGVHASVHVPMGSCNSYSASWGDYGKSYIEEYMTPEGSQWWYELRDRENNLSYQHLDYAKDTLVNDLAIRVIEREHRFADAPPVITHEYVIEDSCRLFWWNRNQERFTLLYDYTAGVDDEWTVLVNEDSIIVHVDSLTTENYGDMSFETMYLHDDTHAFDGPILFGMGHFDSFFPELGLLQEGYDFTGLRCYWIDDELKLHFGEVDCDSIVYFELPEKLDIENEIAIYPVPALSFITIESEGMKIIYVYNMLGQLVKTVSANNDSKVNLDISQMPNGLYFMDVVDVNGTIRIGRFVK